MVYKKIVLILSGVSAIGISNAMKEEVTANAAEYYDQHSQVQQRYKQKLVAEYRDIRNCKNVIDWGCRTGAFIEKVAKEYPETKFYGFDTSASMIECAKKRCASLTNVCFEDYNSDPYWQIFSPAHDLAICISTAHWIENQEQLIKNIAFSLKKKQKYS